MSGFGTFSFNGTVAKCGGNDRWGWALVQWQDDDRQFPTKVLVGGADEFAKKLASYQEGSPITGKATVRNGKNKETGNYETTFVVRELGSSKSAASDDIGF